MAAIKEHVIFGERIKVDENGPRRIHAYTFDGLLHGPGMDPLSEAYGMLQARGIDYGEPHDVLAGLSVIDIAGETYNNTPAQAKFLVTYGQPQWGSLNQMVITITTSVGRRIVRFDRFGNVIRVNYEPGAGPPAVIGAGPTLGYYVVGDVPKLESHTILEFEFEGGDPPPAGLAGSVSSQTWQGKPKWTWACREVVARKMVATTNWRTKLSFEYDSEGWHKVSIYKDPLTGVIPPDVDPVILTAPEGNGWFRPEVNESFDFNALNLPVVYT